MQKNNNNFLSLITPDHLIQFSCLILIGHIILKIIDKFDNIEFIDKNGNIIKSHN